MRAVRALVRGHFDVHAGESVLIGADERTESTLVEAIAEGVQECGAHPLTASIPQLPVQGVLADPYLPDSLRAAAAASDVWFDCCFPYLAGSALHDATMKAARTRYALLATGSAASFARLYGGVDWPALMDFQLALVEYLGTRAGAGVRFTSPGGSDLRFVLDEIKLKRERIARSPGMHTVPGAQSLYPVPSSVRGTVVLDAVFDESYRLLRRPVRIEADGSIRMVCGAAAEDKPRLERALKRAAGGRDQGSLIHFTVGFHPAARVTGEHFIEDIRALGANAIGMGLPWWEPGGGENHPDGVVLDQSLWIDGEPIVAAGEIVGPPALVPLYRRVTPLFG